MAVTEEQRLQSMADHPPKLKRRMPPKKEEKLFRKKPSDPNEETKTQVGCGTLVKFERNKRKRATAVSIYDNAKAQSSVLEQAKEVQANLAPEFPSFVKTMLPSHVTGGFWLGLPKEFCHLHLPKRDMIIALEDESQEVYQTKYLVDKVGLSGGWRGFSMAHKLVERDVLVFHLVAPTKFKVYIIRSKCSDEVDCALGLLKLEACMEKLDTKDTVACEKETMGLEPLPENNLEAVISVDHSDNDSEGNNSEVLDGIRLSESDVRFQEVRGLEDFNILVNGLIIDSEFSKYLKTKYYELCCSQQTFLHEGLLEGLNCKLAAGIISETINIADAIRASKITTSEANFTTWNKTLKAFETMGMNVSFLHARLGQLLNLASKSNRYREELRTLVAKATMNRLDTEIELIFQEVASAPW
ncbi:hypothetical protein FNV43_RR22477 [Rhamnella rubrinervis]|uniref:TF-B3 domain-containing protein n=1 Tax=Rhamnella rubrinervis TaxID=2594499 RepID=A0A8K0GSJ5_9ROSA|nr:hypothetical protein FNV43_RR22477 [Rhamnella rubrinervis]